MEINGWKVALLPHCEAKKREFYTIKDAQAAGLPLWDATVPGCLEAELIKQGELPQDLYFGTNILRTQAFESTHMYYFASFSAEEREGCIPTLCFGGVDTFARIFLDGTLLGECDNMLIPHAYPLPDLSAGVHTLAVHITPATVRAAEIPLPARCQALTYNMDSLAVRKAPYMYGWDILPRSVSAGLIGAVTLEYRKETRIEDVFLYTALLQEDRCELQGILHVLPGDYTVQELTFTVTGECGGHTFSHTGRLHGATERFRIPVHAPVLWWPRNYGAPALYNTRVCLFANGKQLEEKTFSFGIRTVEPERTSLAGKDGTFRFLINGKPVFVLGSNWVPPDVFPYRHGALARRGLELARDLGCNMLRCWGGNIYPDEDFYRFCDENGILVWQDFFMACGTYPNDARLCRALADEAAAVIRARRNHPCLCLWSGDNECDDGYRQTGVHTAHGALYGTNPNRNLLTRGVLADAVYWHDPSRPYLPSSPYIDETAFACGGKTAEDHLWGPRDYFKGNFYNRDSVCHFASETGYHGCPAPDSLRKFLSAAALERRGDNTRCTDPEWLVHAAAPDTDPDGPYAFRIPLMTRQVERLFGPSDTLSLADYAAASQISQAEALKFFIEHFRIQRGYRTGILFWNIIDGWPQVSDAVVDYYGQKKLAYYYVKKAFSPFCLLCDEPDESGRLTLYAVNDSRETKTVHFSVHALKADQEVARGTVCVLPDENTVAVRFPQTPGEYYRISWEGDAVGNNHFVADIGSGLSLSEYRQHLADLYPLSST